MLQRKFGRELATIWISKSMEWSLSWQISRTVQAKKEMGVREGLIRVSHRGKIVANYCTSKVERRERVVELMKSGAIGVGDCVEGCVRSGLRVCGVCGVWVEGVWVCGCGLRA